MKRIFLILLLLTVSTKIIGAVVICHFPHQDITFSDVKITDGATFNPSSTTYQILLKTGAYITIPVNMCIVSQGTKEKFNEAIDESNNKLKLYNIKG